MRLSRIALFALVTVVAGDLSPAIAQAASGPLDSLALPAITYRTRPVAEWMRLFRESRGTSREALWSVFWWDDRSSEVIELLREELQRSWDVAPGPNEEIVGWNTSTANTLRREVDAILDHWGAPHECLGAREYWDPTMLQGCRRLGLDILDVYAPPVAFQDDPDEEVLEWFRSDRPVFRAAGAAVLIGRQREMRPALREIVHLWYELLAGGDVRANERPAGLAKWGDLATHPETLFRWAVPFAGAEAERALAELLEDEAEPVAVKAFLLNRVQLYLLSPYLSPPPVLRDEGNALPAALADLACVGVLPESARRELFRLAGMQPWSPFCLDPFEWTEFDYPVEPLGSPALEGSLARVVAAYLAADPSEWGVRITEQMAEGLASDGAIPTSEDRYDLVRLLEVWRVVLASDRVLAAARPWLHEALERPGRVEWEALRLLCDAGEHGPEVRAAYLRALEPIDPRDETALRRLPRLIEHDEETLAALASLFHRAERKGLLHHSLVAGGLLDAPRDGELAREYLAYLERVGAYETLAELHEGSEPPCPIDPDDGPGQRARKLVCNGRHRKARGEDPTAEATELWHLLRDEGGELEQYTGELVIDAIGELGVDPPGFRDWGCRLLTQFFRMPCSWHATVADVLATRELSRREQAVLCHLEVDALSTDFAWPDLLARQGEASIERVVDLRRRAYRGRLEDLRRVLEITRASALDVELLLRALDHGPAADREEALAILRDFPALATPAVREGVRARALDCDDRVRDAAAALLEVRGW